MLYKITGVYNEKTDFYCFYISYRWIARVMQSSHDQQCNDDFYDASCFHKFKQFLYNVTDDNERRCFFIVHYHNRYDDYQRSNNHCYYKYYCANDNHSHDKYDHACDDRYDCFNREFSGH